MAKITQTLELISRERPAVQYLMRLGLPFNSAAAVVANAAHESRVKPISPSADGSNGEMQWRDAPGVHRLSDMIAWCQDQKLDWQTMEAQFQFFMYEVKTKYPVLYADLTEGTKSLETLVANIEVFYERPAALSDLDDRIETAQWIVKNLAPAPTPEPVPTPVPPAPTPTPTPAPAPNIEALRADAAVKKAVAHAALVAAGGAMTAYHEALLALEKAQEGVVSQEIGDLA